MTINLTHYSEDYTIRFFETNSNGQASLVTMCNFYQEIAFNHTEKLIADSSGEDINKYAFVLVRLKASLMRPPSWKDTISIKTWISPLNQGGRFLVRNFASYDKMNNLIGHGVGSVVFFDLEERMSVSIPDSLKNMPASTETVCDKGFSRLTKPESISTTKKFSTNYTDIDIYQHVNHSRYTEWAFNTLPHELLTQYSCENVEIQYRSEFQMGDQCISHAEIMEASDNITVNHSLHRSEDMKLSALLKSSWKKIP